MLSTLLRLPAGSVKLRLDGSVPVVEAMVGDVQADPGDPNSKEKHHLVTLTVESKGDPIFLTTSLQTGKDDRPLAFTATYRVGEETTDHALGAEHLTLPWVPITLDSATATPLVVPDLSGGDPARGQTLFFGDQARCSQCHIFRGQGGKVGPDLTGIGVKGRARFIGTSPRPVPRSSRLICLTPSPPRTVKSSWDSSGPKGLRQSRLPTPMLVPP